MGYTNSSLATYKLLSPNHSGQRTQNIYMIAPHCVVGQLSAEAVGAIFASPSRGASSNYGIGSDGKVGIYVEEKNRSWCTSSPYVDNRAVTIECASDVTSPYAFKSVVYEKLIELCADICKRNGKKKVLWLGTRAKTEAYKPKDDEMLLVVHRWYANKACPGDWLMARMDDLAAKINEKLNTPSIYYRVRVGSYKLKTRAEKTREKLIKAGFETVIVKIGSYYKCQCGSYTVKANAVALKEKLNKAGFKSAKVVTHNVYQVYNCDTLNLRKSPAGAIIGKLSKGDLVMYGSTNKTVGGVKWMRVVAPDGALGYASASYLRKV